MPPGLQELVMVDPDPEVAAEKAIELLGVSYEQVLAELNFRIQANADRCRRESITAAKAGGERKFMRSAEGGGEVDMMIHPVSYHYWGQRLGYECWEDAQFRREYKRDNDVARVKSRSDRLTIVNNFTPSSAPSATLTAAGNAYLKRKNLAPNKAVKGKRGRWAA